MVQDTANDQYIFCKFKERQSRLYNVIVSKVPESQASTTDERLSSKIVDLISDAGGQGGMIVKCFGIGKPSDTNKRMVKVMFSFSIYAPVQQNVT